MTPQEKIAYWQQHFTAYQQSGLSQRHYCQQHQLAVSSFGYWRKRLRASACSQGKLIPVAVAQPVLANIYLPTGIRIEAPLDSLATLLPLLNNAVAC